MGLRVALRPAGGEDLEAVAAWYGDAVRGPDDVGAAERLAIVLREARRVVGIVTYRLAGGGWLEFDDVAVEPGLRGFGVGSEAVRLVEDDALRRGVARRFCAAVPKENGLGFYFWLRLGYRPAPPEDDPWPGERRRDIIAMVRGGENLEPRT